MSAPPKTLSGSQPFYAAWSLAPLWGALFAALFAASWLQPNHYYPWVAFHSDAWAAGVGLIGAALILASTAHSGLRLLSHGSTLACMAAVAVCLAQYLGQLVGSVGQTFINVAYLLGLLLAMWMGAACANASQKNRLLDTFFFGIALAGFVSVAIQLHQWLHLPISPVWVVEGGEDRPFANIGQPNQLGTLLVCSMVAVGWAVQRKALRPSIALTALLYLLLGLALTRSRTGAVEFLVLLAAACWWRRLWPGVRIFRMAACLTLVYAALLVLVPWATLQLFPDVALSGASASVLNSESTSVRLSVYRMYIDALLSRPWVGYGWNQLAFAQIEVAVRHAPTYSLFSHAHNLFLDILLGLGLPLGLLFVAGICWWMIHSVILVKRVEDLLLLLFVAAIGVHSMLELPLHYGYFLWPTGFIVGVLNVRLGHRVWHSGSVVPAGVVWIACVVAFGLTVRDYVIAEEEYRITRYEALGVGRTPEGPRPELWVLTQLADLIWVARADARPGMPDAEVERLDRVTSMYPSVPSMLKIARACALNGRPEQARLWLLRLQHIGPQRQQLSAQKYWESLSNEVSAGAPAVEWPR